MEIRRFSADLKTPIPGDHRGLWAVPIQFDRANLFTQDLDELAQRLNGLPILLDRPMIVVAMYVDPHGSMDEHSAPEPVLFLVTAGRGFVRIGGPTGETREVTAGDAVLWPASLDHTVWTEDEPLSAIVVHGPPERASTSASTDDEKA
ncbi:MAG TPA: cupin domain-containing protein [Thermomicrobiales bacterium]|jgi:quercetin dioxygenase-like cupin family protein